MKRYNFQMILAMVVASIFFAATCLFAADYIPVTKNGKNIVTVSDGWDNFHTGCDADHDNYNFSNCKYWWESSNGYSGNFWWTYAVNSSQDGESANGCFAEWHAGIMEAGNYEVFVYIPSQSNASRQATYKVERLNYANDNEEKSYVTIDQSIYHGQWVSLGVYYFPVGRGEIKLTDDTGESYFSYKRTLAFDAVKFVSTDVPQPPVDPPTSSCSNGLKVPLYGQRDDSWAGDQLGSCSTTIGKMGCAITSIAMVFKYYGVDTDPADMNKWLKDNGGYVDKCRVNWSKAVDHSDGKVSYDASQQTSYSRDEAGLGHIRKAIDEGHPVIAEVRLSGQQHFVVITGYSGDTFYINDPWYKECATLNTRYPGDPKKTIFGIRVYNGTGTSQPPQDTVKFPATKITTKSSTSKFAGAKNAFGSSLRGQCTWYTYGRVMELVDAGYLAKSVGEDFKNAFWNRSGRDAKNWPSFLGGNWTCTNVNPLPMEKRRKGLIAVWKGGTYGHVGFVEEVSDDKTKYRLSDFNRKGTQKYLSEWYRFEGTDDKLLGGYPCFYELELAQPSEFRVTPDTKTYFASSGTIYPGQTIAKSVTIPSSMSGSTQFAVSWPGSDLDLVITTPSGKVLTSQPPEVIEQYKGDTEEYMVVNVNEQGEWKVEIIAVEVNPSGEPYSFEVIGLEEKDYDFPDTDGDGIPDDVEVFYNLNPLVANSSEDSDNDGVSNLDEYLNKTDPTDPNSKPSPFSSGIFTVDDTGILKIDWLYDGGKYQGEFGIFSIAGMENLTPGSPEFIAEAVKRVLSDSDQGYLAFSDLQEGARFSGLLGGEVRDWNAGPYKGLKSFAMPAGTQFATILVPNSTFQSLAQNPGTEDTNKRPLFSLVSQNPAYGMYLGQMADVNGMGKAYSYEDKDAATSDWDFNDLIVQITGAESSLPSLDSLVGRTETRSKRDKRDNSFTDWRTNSELGQMIMAHIEAPAPTSDTVSMTVTLNLPATLLVYDPKDNVIGKDGGYVAGAIFELKADGTQTVTFPNLNPGSYRVSVQGASAAQGTLTVKTSKGGAELSSNQLAVNIAPHQILTATISADTEPPAVAPLNAVASYDFNADSVVDNTDVEMLVKHWNSCRGQQKYDAFFDVNDDGCITVADIMTVLNAKTVK